MNLLITNTQEDQAYLILRCLRPLADRIIVTISGDSFFQRWTGMSAWSRFVSKRYRVPDCSADWRAGRIQAGNTAAEEAYVQRIEEICAGEGIDVIFPSYDAEVYVLSKNKTRLAHQGVTSVTPDYEGLTRILDKSLTLEAARKVGFPMPRSRVPEGLEQALQVAHEIGPPWVLKPRCNAHGVNIKLVRNIAELEATFVQLDAIQERPLLQEYVPATTKRNYSVLVDPDFEVVSLFSPKVHRTRRVGVRSPCAAVESTLEVPLEAEVRALLRELRVWGALSVQTIIDSRDGQPKLMEINGRTGHNLWYRTELGINEPQMFLRMAQGTDPGPAPAYREGVFLLDPLWDLLHLVGQSLDQSMGWLRSKLGLGAEDDSLYAREPLGQLLRNLKAEYFGRRSRITSPLNRGYLSDPLPPLVRMIRVVLEAIRRRARA